LLGGLQGSARDLGAVRSHMQLAQPDLDYLMSKCNQDRTADGLQTMGHRLAAEVAQYLQVSITFACLVDKVRKSTDTPAASSHGHSLFKKNKAGSGGTWRLGL